MREVSPALWIDKLNAWLVTDYPLVSEGLKSKNFSVNRKSDFFNNLSAEELQILYPLRDFFQLAEKRVDQSWEPFPWVSPGGTIIQILPSFEIL